MGTETKWETSWTRAEHKTWGRARSIGKTEGVEGLPNSASEGLRCEWRRHQVPRTAPRIHGSRIMGRHLRYNLSCTEYPAGKYNYAGDATSCSSLMCLACSDTTVCSRITRMKERALNIAKARTRLCVHLDVRHFLQCITKKEIQFSSDTRYLKRAYAKKI